MATRLFLGECFLHNNSLPSWHGAGLAGDESAVFRADHGKVALSYLCPLLSGLKLPLEPANAGQVRGWHGLLQRECTKGERKENGLVFGYVSLRFLSLCLYVFYVSLSHYVFYVSVSLRFLFVSLSLGFLSVSLSQCFFCLCLSTFSFCLGVSMFFCLCFSTFSMSLCLSSFSLSLYLRFISFSLSLYIFFLCLCSD